MIDEKKNPPSNPKKSSPSTSTSRTQTVSTIWGWLAGLEYIELLTPKMKEYISNQIVEKLKKNGFTAKDIPHLVYIDYANIIKPYIKFNAYINRVHDKALIFTLMKNLWFGPTRISEVVQWFPTNSWPEQRALERKARYLANNMCQVVLLHKISIGPLKYGIPYNARLRNAYLYYVKGYHTQDEIDFAISRYAQEAEHIGWLEDRLSPESVEDKAKQSLKLKVAKYKMLQVETEESNVLTLEEQTKSKINILKEYLSNPNISDSRKEELQLKITKLEEEINA